MFWLHTPDTDWCHYEATSCISTSLTALVTSSLPVSMSQFTNNPIVINTLKIWFQLRRYFGFKQILSLSPICNNHLFPPAKIDATFSFWRRQGISKFKDMYINCVFASFNDLSQKFGLPRSSLFRYFQARHFLTSHDPNFPILSSMSGLDDMLDSPFNSKRLISRIYDCIASLKTITIAKIRADWADELGEDMEDDMWNCALQRVNDSTSCAKLNIIQFKVLHRTHFSKARLAKIYPNSDASCNRCHHTPANLTHMFWSCPALVTYWSMIFKTISEALNTDFLPNAAVAIFGITDRRHSIAGVSNTSIASYR